jgi:hypothetical protein
MFIIQATGHNNPIKDLISWFFQNVFFFFFWIDGQVKIESRKGKYVQAPAAWW